MQKRQFNKHRQAGSTFLAGANPVLNFLPVSIEKGIMFLAIFLILYFCL
ncbi:MAG: hypothetical protein Q8920_08580 [Bacillota bacterium]|nr:hypothetical protein [Bacillota bacterium]